MVLDAQKRGVDITKKILQLKNEIPSISGERSPSLDTRFGLTLTLTLTLS